MPHLSRDNTLPSTPPASETPLLSIVVPSFNQGRFLRENFTSILEQGYPNLEIIVIDGGSSDESVEIIREFEEHITWWVSEKDGGQSDAICKGFDQAKGTLLTWLNSDDYFLEGAIDKMIEAWRRNPEVGLIVGNGKRVDEHRELIAPFSQHPIRFDREALILGIDYILQPCTFFSHEAWKKVGGLRKHLNWCMDWDLWIRITEHFEVETVDAMIAASREYGETKTSSGAFHRWVELRQMAEDHSGMPLTPGTLAYFVHSLHDYVRQDPKAIDMFEGIDSAAVTFWDALNKSALTRVAGNETGFPSHNDARAHHIIPEPKKAAPNPHIDRVRASLYELEQVIERSPNADAMIASLRYELEGIEQHDVSIRSQLQESEKLYTEAVEHLEMHALRIRAVEGRLLFRAGRVFKLI